MRSVKLRCGIDQSLAFAQLQIAVGIGPAEAMFALYRVACWIAEHGKYGKLAHEPELIDSYLSIPGFAAAMNRIDWLRNQDGVTTLHWFCSVSETRKSLGRQLRREILANAACAACGSLDDLQIDHIVPIVRGGSCDRENLQAMCDPCNRAKGRKTMDEFMRERSRHGESGAT